jgi:hypothetical protein
MSIKNTDISVINYVGFAILAVTVLALYLFQKFIVKNIKSKDKEAEIGKICEK